MDKSISSREHKILAEMLYQLRMASGLKQSELARLLGEHQSFVSKYESGERRLDIVELKTILGNLNTNLTEFAAQFEKKLSAR